MAREVSDNQKEIISQAVLFAKEQGTTAGELSSRMAGDTPVAQDDNSRYIVELFQDTNKQRLREIGNASEEQLRQEMVSQLNQAYKTDENPEPFADLDITRAPDTQRGNITENQRLIIAATIDPLNDVDVDTQRLSRQLNGEERVGNNDPARFTVRMFQDTRNGRLRDSGAADTTDVELRQEMLRQLTETLRSDENPEPFSTVDPTQTFRRNNNSLIENAIINNFNDNGRNNNLLENVINNFADPIVVNNINNDRDIINNQQNNNNSIFERAIQNNLINNNGGNNDALANAINNITQNLNNNIERLNIDRNVNNNNTFVNRIINERNNRDNNGLSR